MPPYVRRRSVCRRGLSDSPVEMGRPKHLSTVRDEMLGLPPVHEITGS